jgi:CheY-like chemotaxis protein
MQILIVDDNGDAAETLAMLLRLTGNEVRMMRPGNFTGSLTAQGDTMKGNVNGVIDASKLPAIANDCVHMVINDDPSVKTMLAAAGPKATGK